MSQSFAIASSPLPRRADNNGSSLSAVHMEVETHSRTKRSPQASIRSATSGQ
jgi:hypothetical protein